MDEATGLSEVRVVTLNLWGSDHFGVVTDLSSQTSSGRPVH